MPGPDRQAPAFSTESRSRPTWPVKGFPSLKSLRLTLRKTHPRSTQSRPAAVADTWVLAAGQNACQPPSAGQWPAPLRRCPAPAVARAATEPPRRPDGQGWLRTPEKAAPTLEPPSPVPAGAPGIHIVSERPSAGIRLHHPQRDLGYWRAEVCPKAASGIRRDHAAPPPAPRQDASPTQAKGTSNEAVTQAFRASQCIPSCTGVSPMHGIGRMEPFQPPTGCKPGWHGETPDAQAAFSDFRLPKLPLP